MAKLTEDQKNHFDDKASYFCNLHCYIIMSGAIFFDTLPPNNIRKATDGKNIFVTDTSWREKVILLMIKQLDVDNPGITFPSRLSSKEIVEQVTKALQDIPRQPLELPRGRIPALRIEAARDMGRYCDLLCAAYDALGRGLLPNTTDYINIINLLGDRVIEKAFSLIGYWAAKMEERDRNKSAVAVRTGKKENKKTVLAEMLANLPPGGDKKAYRRWLRDAGNRLDCTENNIRQLLKEMRT